MVNKINLLRKLLLRYQYFNNGIKSKKMAFFDFGVTTCKSSKNGKKRVILPHQFRLTHIISKIDSVKMLEIITYTEYFPNLSRRNLANTICENLEWKTPAGSLKVNSCLSLLNNLEKQGKVKLRPLEKRVHTPKPLKKEKDLFDITDKADIKGSVC